MVRGFGIAELLRVIVCVFSAVSVVAGVMLMTGTWRPDVVKDYLRFVGVGAIVEGLIGLVVSHGFAAIVENTAHAAQYLSRGSGPVQGM